MCRSNCHCLLDDREYFRIQFWGGDNLFRGNSSPAIPCWNDKLLTKFPNSVEEVILPSEFTVLSSKNRRTLLHSVL